MWHTNSPVMVKPRTSFSRAKGKFLLQEPWDKVEAVQENLNVLCLFFHVVHKKIAILSVDHVAGLSQHIKNQIVYTLTLAYGVSIFSSFPEFLGLTVQGGKQNSSFTHQSHIIVRHSRDKRILLSIFREAHMPQDSCTNPAIWNSF